MNRLIRPIYTGMLNGKPLRFYEAPLPEPHLPWHVHNDLNLCLGVPKYLRDYCFEMLKISDWDSHFWNVATSDGLLTIASDWMAHALISSLVLFGRADASVKLAYEVAAGEAFDVLGRDLPPAAREEFCAAAFFNTHGCRPAGGAA